jgi:hypothetical protein
VTYETNDPNHLNSLPETDESGEVDLEQIRHNLSLTPAQRLEQYFQWLALYEAAREAGRRYYGMDVGSAEASE